ncbi:hypothetical protein [Nocardioides terrisoli]|uniref:hypothetical protein n=1 Tax=Nocardioides terrisoli TaxID=3388267 RepID=UPI00287BC251|nr:hypothetical protein [Nocardioides marmorisolisilvae]
MNEPDRSAGSAEPEPGAEPTQQVTDNDLGQDRDALRDLDPSSGVLESDAAGNNPDGLAGEMGLSSERVGKVRGSVRPATHGAEATVSPEVEDPPPEQSADPASGPEPHPDNDLSPHSFDRDRWHGHSHG